MVEPGGIEPIARNHGVDRQHSGWPRSDPRFLEGAENMPFKIFKANFM
jgi:hypothetical protein